MTDDPFYTPGVKIAPHQAKPGQLVWMLRHGGHTMSCEFRCHGEFGWEVQLLRDGQWFYGHIHQLRAEAEEEAIDRRLEYEAKGWTAF